MMTPKEIQNAVDRNIPLPAGLTTTGDLNLGSYAHPLPAGLTTTIKNDFFEILTLSFDEIPALKKALHEGKIDGSTYEGTCRCLVGTLEKAGKGRLTLPHIATRPAERWFAHIREGDTPKTNQNAHYADQWIEEFLATRN